MKPVFFTAAYHSRDSKAARELEELENALCRRAQELRNCGTGRINLSVPDDLVEGPAWIQPVLLFDGVGQKKLEKFPQAALGRPLLEEEADFSPFLTALRLPNRQTLLLGHGGAGAAPVLRALSAWLRNRGEPVSAAALKGEPGWEEVIARLSGTEVLLVPLLLTAGVHLRRDVSLWQSRLTEAGFSVTVRREGLAALPGVREMFLRRVEMLLMGETGK